MAKTRMQLTDDVIRELAAKYVRKCWWADVNELIQEGWAEMLYTFSGGIENTIKEFPRDSTYRGYIWGALSRKYSRVLWWQSSPVSMGRPDNSLAGFHRAPLEALSAAHAETQTEHEPAAEARAKGLQALLRRHVESLAAKALPGVRRGDLRITATLYVLLDGAELAPVAREFGVNSRSLAADVRRAQAAVAQDEHAIKLLTQIVSLSTEF